MQVSPPLVAYGQPAKAIEPGERALDHPTMPTKPLARLDASAGDTRNDIASATGRPAPREVIAFVGMQLGGTPTRPTPSPTWLPDRGNGIQCGFERERVVHIGCREDHREGKPPASTTTWRFVPSLPRSVGFGPVASPPFWPRYSPSPARHATSRVCRRWPDAATVRGAGVPTPQPAASRAAAASKSSRCRTQAPGATVPSRCRS